MAKTVAEYIRENLCVVRQLTQIGKVPPKVINDYKIYSMFSNLDIPSKMDRYSMVAEELKVNEKTVIRAVKAMEETLVVD